MVSEELIDLLLAQYVAPGRDGSFNPNEAYKVSQMLSDPMQAALFGLLAGGQGFAPEAFMPVSDGFDEFDLPVDPLAPYLAMDPGSIEGATALLVSQGTPPSDVPGKLAELGVFDAWSGDDREGAELAQTLANDLFGKVVEYDQSVAAIPGMFRDEEGGWVYGGEGQRVGNTIRVERFKPSETQAMFDGAGLSNPFVQYQPDDFADVSGTAARVAEIEAGLEPLRAERQALRAEQSAAADKEEWDPRVAAIRDLLRDGIPTPERDEGEQRVASPLHAYGGNSSAGNLAATAHNFAKSPTMMKAYMNSPLNGMLPSVGGGVQGKGLASTVRMFQAESPEVRQRLYERRFGALPDIADRDPQIVSQELADNWLAQRDVAKGAHQARGEAALASYIAEQEAARARRTGRSPLTDQLAARAYGALR